MFKNLTDSILYVGVDDTDIDFFEGQYIVPNGISYNSYIIKDEKIALMDTADARKKDEWLSNVMSALGGETPTYLVISHMEPDHSSNINAVMDMYPSMQIVGTVQIFKMMDQFYGNAFEGRRVIVKEGDKLSLGSHTLNFISAPMVHWPEVTMSYEESEKVLFSADGFGKFGSLCTKEDWISEARRYYINIVGKYGMQVQNLLKKASGLDISMICPLHGPVLTEDLGYYINKYFVWSSYEPEEKGVCIAYASAHGNTRRAALTLKEMLEAKGVTVEAFDVSRDDVARIVENAFKYDRLVLCSITYDTGIFPPMANLLYRLKSKGLTKRKVGIIENGSWAPKAGSIIKDTLKELENIKILEPMVTIKSALNEESKAKLEELAAELLK